MTTGIAGQKGGNAIAPYESGSRMTKTLTHPTVQVTGTNLNSVIASFQAYADSDNEWWLTFQIYTLWTNSAGDRTITVAGVAFDDTQKQIVSFTDVGINSDGGSGRVESATQLRGISATATTEWMFGGTVKLASEPTWAAANLETRGADQYIKAGTSETAGLVGGSEGVAVPSGQIGETIVVSRPYASRIGLTDGTNIDVVSMTGGNQITSGVWDIYAYVGIDVASTTISYFNISLSKTSVTQASSAFEVPISGELQIQEYYPASYAMTSGFKRFSIGPVRVNTASAIDYYLVVNAKWAAGVGNGWGSIVAVRVG